jgi:hypothetical protein
LFFNFTFLNNDNMFNLLYLEFPFINLLFLFFICFYIIFSVFLYFKKKKFI